MHTSHVLTGLFLAVVAAPALAGGSDHSHGPDTGEAGVPAEVDCTVEVAMDEMSFTPSDLTFAPGETVRFVVTNTGEMVHEFSIGTDGMHDAHAGEMRRMFESGMMSASEVHEAEMRESGVAHEDPNSVLLEPGETGEVIWTFSGEADLEFACNVPGHRAGGMTGEIEVTDTSA